MTTDRPRDSALFAERATAADRTCLQDTGRDGSAPPKLREDAREGHEAVRFGECASCFNALERPFWDSLCFACQDSLDDLDDMEGFDD